LRRSFRHRRRYYRFHADGSTRLNITVSVLYLLYHCVVLYLFGFIIFPPLPPAPYPIPTTDSTLFFSLHSCYYYFWCGPTRHALAQSRPAVRAIVPSTGPYVKSIFLRVHKLTKVMVRRKVCGGFRKLRAHAFTKRIRSRSRGKG
jgi:hypothetical protein